MQVKQILMLGVTAGAFFTAQAAPPGGGTTESPDKTGIHAAFVGPFSGFGGASSGGIIYTVPAGKRLVLETVTAMCATAVTEKVYRAQVHMTNGGSSISHHLTPTFTGTDANPNFNISIINWSGRLYADAGAVQVGAFKSGTLSGSYSCHYTISGYLVAVP